MTDAAPDVPPDPPAVDRDELARKLQHAMTETGVEPDLGYCGEIADVLLSSGVLVDAADVRARALEDAADALDVDNDVRSIDHVPEWLRDRAVSEREGDRP